MDKNSIKKYAVWARNELIARVAQKANQYGITEAEIISASADSIHGKLLTPAEKKQRTALIEKIKNKGKNGFQLVMEEVAYTWFNRFTAIRFMEVNGYLPSHVRVFTDEENRFAPQILAEAIHLDMPGLDMEKVFELKQANKTEELYKYLIITQCNALYEILPGMFQRIEDYTELLLPDNLLREGSVVEQMITLIPEDDWTDQVQIIGWLYQFYNIEPKAAVFAKNGKVSKDEIPAATQLFTPDWIVRYMVENSLGRLWIEGHPNDDLKATWKYYLDEAEQDETVKAQLDVIRRDYANIKPEEIKVIDPCMGSGHILCYMFDVLVQIYEAYGYTARDAVTSIIENNIYGLDIDDRASQLAYFAVMMKARQYDRRFFSRGITPNVFAIEESNGISRDTIDYFINGDDKLEIEIRRVLDIMENAKEYGSILNIDRINFVLLYSRFNEIADDVSLFRQNALDELLPLVRVAETMSRKYSIVVTNPPYMSSSNMNETLLKFVKKNYPEGKNDLFSVFIQKCLSLGKENGFVSLITMHSWMFLSRYQALRLCMLKYSIENILHLGSHAFEDIGGEVVQTASFIVRKSVLHDYRGRFERLTEYSDSNQKIANYRNPNATFYCQQSNYRYMVDNIISYWISSKIAMHFSSTKLLGDTADCRQGIATGNNDIFLRFWHEINLHKVNFHAKSQEDMVNSQKLYVPYNKGGSFRRWYGNHEYVIKMDSTNYNLLLTMGNHLPSRQYYYRSGITWNDLSTALYCARYVDSGFVFDAAGPTCFYSGSEKYLLGLLNSNVAQAFLNVICQGLHYSTGHIPNIPFLHDREQEVKEIVESNLSLSKNDWDSFETSWNFKTHPLIINTQRIRNCSTPTDCSIALAWDFWNEECTERFNKLKENEEELNRIFIEIYDLKDELTPEVAGNDITVRLAEKKRDVKSFISYAVGCMFGRYSLDEAGIAYAGGEWDDDKYTTFRADKDNVLPICDDEYFEDDIVGKFVRFLEVVYGKGTLEENLKFIADTLGGNGSPRDVIRSYFLNDFYADHLKVYQKRPIYWQFDSGKKNGFKCLIYMHRYQPDTIARIRTDYVHEQQARYRTAIADLEQRIQVATTSERVKLTKLLQKLKDQETEIRVFEEKIHHLADQMIRIDLDDGVKHNYEIFKDVLTKIK